MTEFVAFKYACDLYVGIGLLIGFAICWLIVQWRKLKNRHLRWDEDDCILWRAINDIPDPGSLVAVEDGHGQHYGYTVGTNGEIYVVLMPNHLNPPQTTPRIFQKVPFANFTRWAYIENRIREAETLMPNRTKYIKLYPYGKDDSNHADV